MGNPAYVYINLIEDAAGLSSSTEDASYPVTNIYDRVKANPFKFTVANGYVEIDLGAPIAFDMFGLVGHNATSLTGTVKADNTPVPTTTIATLTHRTEDLWSIASATAQYIRFTSTAGDITQIGEMILGTRTVLPRAARWGIGKGITAEGVTYKTYGGATWDYENYAQRYLRPTFRFPESEYAAFELFSTRVQRNPFLWIPNVSNPEVYYVKKMRGFDPEPVAPGRDGSSMALWYDWRVAMEAESLGLAVLA